MANFDKITTLLAFLSYLHRTWAKAAICALPIQILTSPLNSATQVSYNTAPFL